MNVTRKNTRRELLRGLGASVALLPMLDAEHASAQSGPRRLLIIHKNNGMHVPAWFPAAPTGGEADLASIELPEISKVLDRRKKDIILIGGIEQRSFMDVPSFNGHHSASHSLTGIAGTSTKDNYNAGGISLDQWVAQQIGKTVQLRQPVLNTSIIGAQGDTLSWLGRDRGVSAEGDPWRIFTRLFASAALPATELERLRRERKSVLDYVATQLGTFGKRLGNEDREKVDYHLSSVREVEKRLSAVAGGPCAAPTLPMKDPRKGESDQIPTYIRAHLDLIVGAMACDVSRVGTLKIGHAGDYPLAWIGEDFNRQCSVSHCGPDVKPTQLTTYHDIAHNQYKADIKPLKIKADQWWTENLFLYALDKMAAIKEGAGTMLDNSIVVLTDDMGNGSSHDQRDVPWVIGGRAGGSLRTGRYVNHGRRPHNGVLVALATAMGFPVETYGDPKYGGILPGILA